MTCYDRGVEGDVAEERQVVTIERLFRGLADKTRLRLLNLMRDQEVCVCYFTEILKVSQPTISRHLAYLRSTGLVTARRQGKWMHYRITVPRNPYSQALLVDLLRWLAADKDMRRDRVRLTTACCTPHKFIRLEGAPLPQSLEKPLNGSLR